MKTQKNRLYLSIVAMMVTLSLAGCGPADESSDGGVFIVSSEEASHPETPALSDPFTAPNPLGTSTKPPVIDAVEPTLVPVESIGAAPSVPELGEEETERAEALLHRNFFIQRLSVTSTEERVYLATDTGNALVIAIYDEELEPQRLMEFEKRIEPQHHQRCQETLKIVDLGSHLGLIELGCGDEVDVNVRRISYEGELIGEGTQFTIEGTGQISISEDYNNIVILLAGEEQVTWFELHQQSEFDRTMTHELSAVEGERRLTGLSHHGTRALLQYSDGLIRKLSYAMRCGTTSDLNIMLQYADGTPNSSRVAFVWDQYGNRYVRTTRLDSEVRIESLPWNFSDQNNEIDVIVVPHDADTYEHPYLILSAEGPRLVFNWYSDDEFTVTGMEDRPDAHVEKTLHGSVTQAWSILSGRASMLLISGRCVERLHTVKY